MKKCSVIVPLYKGKEYIEACIAGIVAQTYTDWELILMDDGSPDDTYDFVANVISRYPNCDMQLFRRENRGVAETRNECITLASGEYIAFMDQDDILAPDYLERLMGATKDGELDIVLCGYKRQRDDGKVLLNVTLVNDTWSKYRVTAPWARVYKKSFLQKNNLKYLTTPCGEDIYLTLRAYALTNRIAVVEDYAGYIWRYNASSVSNTKQRSVMIADAACETFEKIMASLPKTHFCKAEDEEYFFIRSCIFYLLFSSHSENSSQVEYAYNRYFSFLETYFPNYIKNKQISLFRPRSESFSVRCAVWGFITLKKIGLAKPFAKLWSKLAK
ncbi:MAG: glycosyltransferase [Clostridia bacterium]|nr:glycosyltransferase [Clostridia bacterium]